MNLRSILALSKIFGKERCKRLLETDSILCDAAISLARRKAEPLGTAAKAPSDILPARLLAVPIDLLGWVSSAGFILAPSTLRRRSEFPPERYPVTSFVGITIIIFEPRRPAPMAAWVTKMFVIEASSTRNDIAFS